MGFNPTLDDLNIPFRWHIHKEEDEYHIRIKVLPLTFLGTEIEGDTVGDYVLNLDGMAMTEEEIFNYIDEIKPMILRSLSRAYFTRHPEFINPFKGDT